MPSACFEDDDSAVFKFADTLVNLLKATQAPDLVAPARVARPEDGSRFVFTIKVDDVDAKCDELTGRGIELLNGPIDRPWGPRTASFKDPSGHIWEIATLRRRTVGVWAVPPWARSKLASEP